MTSKGLIYVSSVLDRKKQTDHESTVTASDKEPFYQRLTSEVTVATTFYNGSISQLLT